MLSSDDLERLIIEKRREIEKEKTVLGLSQQQKVSHLELQDIECKENTEKPTRAQKKRSVSFTEDRRTDRITCDSNEGELRDYEIPLDLERYIRRYLGLPVMLKAGEYSPNNPLLRGERVSGDALLGLGEYERRRNTLRKIRQQQYREYLDQQAKKKQEAKEQAERERREREERERQKDEQERLEREANRSPELRRASVCYVPESTVEKKKLAKHFCRSKVDTGVQVGTSRPLSVAVQTDDSDLYRLPPFPSKTQLTQAERELSPRTVVELHEHRPVQHDNRSVQHDDRPVEHDDRPVEHDDRPVEHDDRPVQHDDRPVQHDDRPIQPAPWARDAQRWNTSARRRSYGDFDERASTVAKKSNRDKLISDLRHTYMPSIFDADAIHMRNQQAEKEAAERRQFYQQELKNQILEQQRIREERKTREKMLEQAEMRRLEEQLRMLRAAQSSETQRQHHITDKMQENATDFEKKRSNLQKDIDLEHQRVLRAATHHPKRTTTSHSDTTLSKLPFYYPRDNERPPFSTNIPDNSIFNPNYDVESYLRKNLNPSKESLLSNGLSKLDVEKKSCDTNVIIEKALIHECPRDNIKRYEPSFIRKNTQEPIQTGSDEIIPVLKHSPKSENHCKGDFFSEAMKRVDDKWKVPAVQKNILKSLPNEEGKNVSILTQLGSIRRQLQLEQLRLDGVSGDGDK